MAKQKRKTKTDEPDSISVYRAPVMDLWDGRRIQFDPPLEITLYWYEKAGMYVAEVTLDPGGLDYRLRGAQGADKKQIWEDLKRQFCRKWRSAATYPGSDKPFTKALRKCIGDMMFEDAPQRIPVTKPVT